jgi:FdrA protein
VALDADPGTDVVVVVSKPPAPQVADEVRALADALATPVHLALLGEGTPDLTSVVEQVVGELGGPVPTWPTWAPDEPPVPRPGTLRGLFSGGTLCDEAMAVAVAALGPVRSNTPLRPEWALPPGLGADGHAMIDFGDDRLTAGRPHPMIDPSLRPERLAREAADPAVAVVLLDVVLGHGADPDPAATLAPAVRAARATAAGAGRGLAVVVSLCGTAGDPQDRERQALALRDAGASVLLSNAAAARLAVSLLEEP